MPTQVPCRRALWALVGRCLSPALRHYEHAHLLSNIEKPQLPILGSMFPFWNPTADLICQYLEPGHEYEG